MNKIEDTYLESKLRNVTPKYGFQEYNRVKIRKKRVFDNIIGVLSDRLHHEGMYISYIRKYVKKGETVVVIGGHFGVSAVAAANQTGESGLVIVFEATVEGTKRVEETAQLNDVLDRITVNQAIVGPLYNTKGKQIGNIKQMSPHELPDCDTLAIDCDGCELDVIKNLDTCPNKIIVEHHGESPGEDGLNFEYREEYLKQQLCENGYIIVDQYVEDRIRGGYDTKIGYFVGIQE